MNLAHWLARAAAVDGNRPALALGDTLVCRYRQFADRAARGAGWLRAQGLAPDDRVGLFRGNDPDYLLWLWSVWWAGLVAVPINAKLHGLEAAYILGHGGAKLCLADRERAEVLGGHLPEGCAMAITATAPPATAPPGGLVAAAAPQDRIVADSRKPGAAAAASPPAAWLNLPAAEHLDALDPAPIADRRRTTTSGCSTQAARPGDRRACS